MLENLPFCAFYIGIRVKDMLQRIRIRAKVTYFAQAASGAKHPCICPPPQKKVNTQQNHKKRKNTLFFFCFFFVLFRGEAAIAANLITA